MNLELRWGEWARRAFIGAAADALLWAFGVRRRRRSPVVYIYYVNIYIANVYYVNTNPSAGEVQSSIVVLSTSNIPTSFWSAIM